MSNKPGKGRHVTKHNAKAIYQMNLRAGGKVPDIIQMQYT